MFAVITTSYPIVFSVSPSKVGYSTAGAQGTDVVFEILH